MLHDYSVMLQEPKFGINVLQILQGHFLGFHLRIPILTFSNKPVYLRSDGTRSLVIGSKYLTELEPFQTVFTPAI